MALHRILVTAPILLSIALANGSSVDQDLTIVTITYSQKAILDKFKARVVEKLPHDYMKEDIYLIRWLRARNFDLENAERMLMENLKWREVNKMDTIVSEYWKDLEEMYPYTSDSFDKEGRPVVIIHYGDWDVRAASVSGNFPRLVRYGEKIFEEVSLKVRCLQKDGNNVTQAILIADLDGFSSIRQGCPQCLFYFFEFYDSLSAHYTGLINKVFLINASNFFSTLLQSVMFRLSPRARKLLNIYGQDPNQYSKALLKYIDKSQLPKTLGGTKSE